MGARWNRWTARSAGGRIGLQAKRQPGLIAHSCCRLLLVACPPVTSEPLPGSLENIKFERLPPARFDRFPPGQPVAPEIMTFPAPPTPQPSTVVTETPAAARSRIPYPTDLRSRRARCRFRPALSFLNLAGKLLPPYSLHQQTTTPEAGYLEQAATEQKTHTPGGPDAPPEKHS